MNSDFGVITYDHVFYFVCMLTRTIAFLSMVPVIGSSEMPGRVRAGLAFALTFFLFIHYDRVTFHLPRQPLVIIWVMATEIAKGTIMGFIGRVIVSGINTGLDFMGQVMGLNMASMFDPQSQTNVALIERLYILFFMALFYQLDIHHEIIVILAKSFDLVPVGVMHMDEKLLRFFLLYSTQIFVAALKISAPLSVLMTITNIVWGIIVRTAPQMNMFFSVGMFLNIPIGFALLIASLPYYDAIFKAGMHDILRATLTVVEYMK